MLSYIGNSCCGLLDGRPISITLSIFDADSWAVFGSVNVGYELSVLSYHPGSYMPFLLFSAPEMTGINSLTI
jgi:hypothetical protein